MPSRRRRRRLSICPSVTARMSAPSRSAWYHSTMLASASSRPTGGRQPSRSARARGVELQIARLVRVRALVERPAQLRRPQLGDPLDQPADRPRVLLGRAEVPSGRVLGRVPQRLREHEVAAQRVEHVLPRADRVGVANARRLAGERRAHDVGHEPVLAPVAAADHVAGARRRDARAVLDRRRTSCERRSSTSSAQPLELEYGSWPPIGSSSR